MMDLRKHQQILRDAIEARYAMKRAEREAEENASAKLAEATEGPEAGQLHLWP